MVELAVRYLKIGNEESQNQDYRISRIKRRGQNQDSMNNKISSIETE